MEIVERIIFITLSLAFIFYGIRFMYFMFVAYREMKQPSSFTHKVYYTDEISDKGKEYRMVAFKCIPPFALSLFGIFVFIVYTSTN